MKRRYFIGTCSSTLGVIHLRKLLVFVLLIFLITVTQPLASAEEPSESAVYQITQIYEVTNQGTSNATDVTVTIYVLENWSGWASQEVWDKDLPSGKISDTEDNRSILISIGSLGAGESKEINVTQTVRVDSIDMQFEPDVVGNSVPPGINNTSPVDDLWENTTEIMNEAHELTDNQPNFYYKAKQIFDFVNESVDYVQSPGMRSALEVYQSRTGDCADQSNLFIALCRAVDIPAKFVSCYGYRPKFAPNLESMGHAIAIVYFPNVGWIPVDLTWNSPRGLFGELGTDHIISATSGGVDMFGSKGNLTSPDVARITFRGGDCTVKLKSSRITRLVAVEPTISIGPEIEDSTLSVTVTVHNKGTRSVSNVNVGLQVDNTYFEVPPSKNIGDLRPGHHPTISFDVRLKQSVENSSMTAIVTYDTSKYGSFLAKKETPPISAQLPKGFFEFPISRPMLLILILLAGSAIGAAFLLRR